MTTETGHVAGAELNEPESAVTHLQRLALTTWSNKVVVGVLAVLIAAYVGVFLRFSPLVLQDYPNHLARAVVMVDLIFHHGQQFGQLFQFHFLAMPYVVGDICLTGLIQLFGMSAAAAIWPVLVFLSFPCAVLAYLRARRTAPNLTLLLLLLSVYLSTDTFFVMGFGEFRLAVALVLFALALTESLRREWSNVRFAAFAGLVVFAYFTHLAAVVFLAAALGTSAALRIAMGSSRLDREIRLLIPVVGVLAWHFLVASGYRRPHDEFAQADSWGTAFEKLMGLRWDSLRYDKNRDPLIVWALVACVAFCVRDRRLWNRRALVNPNVLEPWILAVMFLGLYVVFPAEYAEASYVDVRALAFVPFFLIVGLLNLSDPYGTGRSRSSVVAVGLAVLVAVANLGYLAYHFRTESVWLAQYRAVAANVPEHGVVLPIYTARKRGNTRSHLHAASFAVIDRAAVIPYLFSADLGDPMKYFRYVKRPAAPDELWYGALAYGPPGSRAFPDPKSVVDWTQVSKDYQFLLIMKPFEAALIPLKTRSLAENDAAALLAIQ